MKISKLFLIKPVAIIFMIFNIIITPCNASIQMSHIRRTLTKNSLNFLNKSIHNKSINESIENLDKSIKKLDGCFKRLDHIKKDIDNLYVFLHFLQTAIIGTVLYISYEQLNSVGFWKNVPDHALHQQDSEFTYKDIDHSRIDPKIQELIKEYLYEE